MEANLQPQPGSPRTRRRMIDTAQKVTAPPARALDGSLARETLTLVVGGVEVEVVVERQLRPCGGAIGYWLCPVCSRRCCHLFVVANASASSPVVCRKCFPGGLTYRSQHTLNPALIKAAKIRRKLGAAPGLLSRLPPRPPHWRRDYWQREVTKLAAVERVIAEMLGATVRAAKRQKARIGGGQR